jgi:hypothetical protein
VGINPRVPVLHPAIRVNVTQEVTAVFEVAFIFGVMSLVEVIAETGEDRRRALTRLGGLAAGFILLQLI